MNDALSARTVATPGPGAPVPGREVSCQAIGLALDAALRQGAPIEGLLAGIPHDLGYLRDRHSFIGWDVFLRFQDNLARYLSREDVFEMGAASPLSRYVRPFLTLAGLLVKPGQFYRRIAGGARPSLQRFFACLDTSLQELEGGDLLIDVQVQPGYSLPHETFWVTIQGSFAGIPAAMGLPRAEVAREPIERGVRYRVRLPRGGPWQRLLRWLGRLRAGSMAGADLRDALEGIDVRAQQLEREINEHRRTEAALRESQRFIEQMVRTIPGCVFVRDLRSRKLVYSSQPLESLLGVATASLDLDGLLKTVHEDDRAAVFPEQARYEALAPGAMHTYRFRARRPDGGWNILAAREVVFERGGSGGVLQVLGLLQDVTQEAKLQDELAVAQRLEVVGRLAGGIAHDFNNLLVVIMGYADELRTALAATPHDEAAQQIFVAAERAAALTHQLLAFGRKQTAVAQPVNLNQVVGTLRTMLARLIGEHIEVVVEPGAALWSITGNSGQLEQVATNLALNARDAMPDGGRLSFRTGNVTLDGAGPAALPPGDYVLLTVADTGVGMSEEVKAHLFEPYFTTKGLGRGTGLGLATVHGIVLQLGGHIVVDSEPGRGTTFRLYFPRVESIVAPPAGEPRAAIVRGHETILLVEDDASVCRLIEHGLTARGFLVRAFASPADALQALQDPAFVFQALITDLVMPGMSGQEFVARLQANRPDTRVIYISGYNPRDSVADLAARRGAPLLIKPFTLDALARALRQLLDG